MIDILLFLVAINFFHYGQLLLPIICLILFLDNKLKFKVNNLKTFILLCLFGITFFVFSYKLGFFSVMGFCLPMAYYIGSNIKNPNEENIKKIIYIFAFGMITHVLLNMGYTYVVLGNDMLTTQGHYDIWLGTKVADTATAVNYVFIIGMIYYSIFYEKCKTLKLITALLFIVALIYDMFLGRRTPILMFILSFGLVMIIDFVFFHVSKKNIIKILVLFITVVVLACLLLYVYCKCLDTRGRMLVNYSALINKFKKEGLSSGRLEVFIESIKLAPSYLWGGQKISEIINIRPHDLLMDIYDYAGIIPFILMFIYLINIINVFRKALKKKEFTNEIKVLVISLFLTITMQFCLEPIMTGSSNFLMIVIIFAAVIENGVLNERK